MTFPELFRAARQEWYRTYAKEPSHAYLGREEWEEYAKMIHEMQVFGLLGPVKVKKGCIHTYQGVELVEVNRKTHFRFA